MAAVQGQTNAQVKLGYYHSKGLGGLEVDKKEAVRWYRLAADKGNANAQNNLGVCYTNGVGGLEVDLVEASKLFKMATAPRDP